MKYPLHCTSLGKKRDSSITQATGATLGHHCWASRKDGVSMSAPVVAAEDGRWPSRELVRPLTGPVFSPAGCPSTPSQGFDLVGEPV